MSKADLSPTSIWGLSRCRIELAYRRLNRATPLTRRLTRMSGRYLNQRLDSWSQWSKR